MKQITPEIDRLLWLVAESGDSHAAQEFEERFPGHSLELGKRMAMVRDLKGARQSMLPSERIPVFQPPVAAPAFGSRRLTWALAGVAFAAIGFGAYFGARALLPSNVSGQQNGEPQLIPLKQKQDSAPSVVYKVPPNAAPRTPSNPPGVSDEPPPAYQLTHDVFTNRVSLGDALRAIGGTCGLTIEIAPGMPGGETALAYRGMTGMEMLQDLGPKFGFTAFDEGDGRVLVIPAVDSGPEPSSDHMGQKPPVQGQPTERGGNGP